MRHTKIIATVGPTSGDAEILSALIDAGVDVFRLNFSHGTHASHAGSFRLIRDLAAQGRRHVAIMQDLSGPKIRTGPLQGGEPVELEDGATMMLCAGSDASRPGRIFTPYAPLVESAGPGDCLLLDDGRIELRVVGRAAGGLETTVVHGGRLGAHKGISAPGVALPPSALTEKDVADLEFGLSLGVDLVALSFVQTAADVAGARAVIERAGRATPIVAKIERPAAVTNITEILEAAQGVMVARGDLGLEMKLEQLPRMQKEILRAARAHGKPAIVATQVLESMRVEPRPTRAEVSDAANAVDGGADAIMLTGETAAGAFPVRAVQTLDAIIRDAESLPPASRPDSGSYATGSRHTAALAEAAVTLATTGHADAIVAVTHEGTTARLLSAMRPAAPILAATPNAEIAGTLALLWGVAPFITVERTVDRIQQELRTRQLLEPGALVVFINVTADQSHREANFLHVRRM
jgi:pyruvate kinase